MSFFSSEFFVIVIGTILFYFVVPKKIRWIVLLLSSCFFYVYFAGKRAFVILLFSVFVSYLSGKAIENDYSDRKRRKLLISISLVILLGVLAIVKIARFIGYGFRIIVIPLGISYYTLSLVGYLIDVYSCKCKSEHSFFKLLLFSVFFPKILQGPISKYRDLKLTLYEGHSFNYESFCFGIQRILWGYFKKLVIVERATPFINSVFSDLPNYSGGGAVLLVSTIIAVVCHYCDFSGYMDIVLGISETMGIKLDENFKQPFFSHSAAEFWRRWHITLGQWFKDYVYMFLVINPSLIKISQIIRTKFGKRAGKSVLIIIPLLIVWILTGLWHGTGLDYIVWGLYWGLIITISNIFEPELKKLAYLLRINTDTSDWKIFQVVRTFVFFSFGLLISTLVGLDNLRLYTWLLLKNFSLSKMSLNTFSSFGLDKANLNVLLISIIILWIVDYKQQTCSIRESVAKLNGMIRWFLYAVLVLSVVVFGIYGPGFSMNGFAYANF